MMKLIDAFPRWILNQLKQRVGFSFICPHCTAKFGVFSVQDRGKRIYVQFSNPLDGAPSQAGWERTGDAFETLSVTPSILQYEHNDSGEVLYEHWHGYMIAGELNACPNP